MKRMIALLAGAFVLAACVGCGLPQYAGKPTEARNRVSFKKDILGGGGELEFGADTTGTVRDLKVKTAEGGETTIGELTMTQKPSETIASWVGPMEVYRDQIEKWGDATAKIATANWEGLAASIREAAPIASAYVGALGQLKLAKAQRPQLIEQLTGLVMSGKVSAAGLGELDMEADIMAEVDRRVAARIAELQAEAAATSQPSE